MPKVHKEALLFETQLTHVPIYEIPVAARVVVGLEVILEGSHTKNPDPIAEIQNASRVDSVRIVNWPNDTPRRLVAFWKSMHKLQTGQLEGVPGISCFSLSAYVTGCYEVFDVPFDPKHLGRYGLEADIDSLEPGQAYIAVGNEKPKHVFYGLGVQHQHENLSILGTGGPLSFTNTFECLEAFEADSIYQLGYSQPKWRSS